MKDCRLEGLIMRISVLPNTDYKEISRIIAEDIDASKCAKCIYKDVYKYAYENHLQSEECENWISKDGAVWSLEETNAVAKKLEYDFEKKPYTKDEFRMAMHLMYYQNYKPLKESNVTLESTAYGRLADHYLNSPCILVDEYFNC